jgi:hypothetical protein
MATLSDLYDMGAMSDVPSGQTQKDYKDYVLACQESGKKPLTFDAWIAAGKPKG